MEINEESNVAEVICIVVKGDEKWQKKLED